MEPFNILHLRTSQGVYGAEKVILGLAGSCEKTRHTIGCLTKKGKYGRSFLEEIRRLGLQGEEIQSSYNIWDFRAVWHIVKIMKERRIGILHTHDFISDILGFLASRIYRVPLVKTEHGKTYNRNLWINICKKIDDRIITEFFDHIVYVSENTKQNKVNKPGIKNLSVIHNGVDVDAFSLLNSKSNFSELNIKNELGIPSDAKVIGSIGRLSAEKGYDYLLKAAQRLVNSYESKVVFLLLGEGKMEDELKNLVNELGITSKVVFSRYRSDIPQIMSIIDVYVSSSLTEGFPISVIEALAAGKPVVATNVGGVPDLIKDGSTGLLIPPGNSEALVNSITQLLDNEAMAKQFGDAGRELVRKNYSVKTMAAKYEDIYETLFASKDY